MNWLFQCNPTRYDLVAALAHSTNGNWAVNQHRDIVAPGDRVFFWETGADACLRAVGTVASPVYERGEDNSFGRYAVDILYQYKVEPVLTREEITQTDTLNTFRPFMWAMGTNIPIHEEAVVAKLEDVLRSRLHPLGTAAGIERTVNSQKSLDDALKNSEREAILALQKEISSMDPTAFEWLIRALLLKLGYSNVVVTKRSGDGGIDVTADLVAGGIAIIKTAVQVKRMKSVGRPVVQSLRGSLSAHQAGVVVTSGRFAENALEDAIDSSKQPIACIDGARLAQLMLEHRLGVERRMVAIYTLKPEDLQLERLESIVESGPGA